jgi:CheY-like chemotaxis protein
MAMKAGETPARRVLIVDDDAAVRELAADILIEAGFSVACEHDAERALVIAAAEQFDVILTDVVMPNMTGPELAARIRQLRPELAVLFVSGFNEERAFRGVQLPQRTAFLRKPYSPEALIERIEAVLGDRI